MNALIQKMFSWLHPKPKGYESEFYITAWIDLLGQGEKLETARPPKTTESETDYAKAFNNAFGPVIVFRKQISKVRNALVSQSPAPPVDISLNPQKLELYKKYTQQNIQLHFIADSAILRIPLGDSYIHPPLMSVLSLLNQLAINMLLLLAMRMPIRGGIAVGWSTKLELDDIYGQADSRAHWAESKRAKYPRIIIHSSLLDFLNAWRIAGDSPEEKKINQALVEEIHGFFEKDTFLNETDTVLSYLATSFKGEDNEESPYMQSVRNSCLFISEEVGRFKATNNAKLLLRYEALMAYFIRYGYKIE